MTKGSRARRSRRSEAADITGRRLHRGVEQVNAVFQGMRFSPHRHDTFIVGIATHGVQCFVHSHHEHRLEVGRVWLLHPDEAHDGYSLNDDRFGFRAAYVDPALIMSALGGAPPEAASRVLISANASIRSALSPLWNTDGSPDEAEIVEALESVARLIGYAPKNALRSLPVAELDRVRERIAAMPDHRFSLAELEALAGMDRWSLARSFRSAFGVSPTRYRTMRQLDLARSLIAKGEALAAAAAAAGFADQSHMTRKFASAYGVTPHRWRRWRAAEPADTIVQDYSGPPS